MQPQGQSWGEEIWRNSYQFRGSYQVGVGRKILEQFEWWKLEPHLEWIPPVATESLRPFSAYAAGVPRRLRIVYFSAVSGIDLVVKELEAGVEYDAHFITPSSGKRLPLGKIKGT